MPDALQRRPTPPNVRERPDLNQRPAGQTEGLGDMLKARGLIAESDISKASACQQQFGRRIGNILVRMGALSE